MKRFLFFLSLCVLFLAALSLTPAVKAAPEWYMIDHPYEYSSGILDGCATYTDGTPLTFTNPADSTLKAIVWSYTGTIHDSIGGTFITASWSTVGYPSTNPIGAGPSVPGSTGATITRCTGDNESGSVPGCTEFGYSGQTVLNTMNGAMIAAGASPSIPPSISINCGSARKASVVINNVKLIYFGEVPAIANFTYEPESGSAPLQVEFTDTSFGPVTTWDWYIDDEHFSDAQNPEYLFTLDGSYTVKLVVNEGLDKEDEFSQVVTVGTPDPLVRPFNQAVEGLVPEPSFFSPDDPLAYGLHFAKFASRENIENSIIGFSEGKQQVHAGADGEIKSIVAVSTSECVPDADTCPLVFSQSTESVFRYFSFEVSGIYAVTITTGENRYLTYFVENPYDYVNVGDFINAGCPLGESVQILDDQVHALEIGYGILELLQNILGLIADPGAIQAILDQLVPSNYSTTAHFVVIQELILFSGDIYVLPSLAAFTEYPEDEPRTCDYIPSACLNYDPELKHPERWAVSGLADFFSGGGVTLYPGDWIEQQLALDSMVNYTAEIWARNTTQGQGSLHVQIGQSVTSFSLVSTDFVQSITTPGTHQPDLDSYYTLQIRNSGSIPIFIQSACLRDENEGSARPATCYFANNSFEGSPAAQGWTITGTVNDGIIPGEILMRDDDTIAQNAILFPDGAEAHVYIVSVTATVGGADFETLSTDSDSDVGFQWEYPASNGFEAFIGPNSSNLYPVSGFFTATENGVTFLPNYEIAFFAEVPVATMQNSTFTIKAIIDSANPNMYLRVREVCIDDPFDNHEDPDAWIPPSPFPTNCFSVSPPPGNEIGAWIFYHWSQLDRFFKCDLMVLLNKIHETAQRAYLLIGWQFRYWQATLMMSVQWFSSDMLGWLGGHFNNMAVGQVTNIQGDSSANFWDVLLALINLVLGPINEIISVVLGIIQQAADLLFTVLTAGITFVIALISQALNLVLLAQMLLGSVLTAYNTAEPVTIPGLPDCSADPQNGPWCIGMWVMENTIFSGTGAFIIPILTGILSIHLILWVIGEIKQTVTQTGQSA